MGKAADEEKQGTVQIDPKDVPFWFSSRLGLALIGFLGFINVYAVRVNLSVAIVCMVNHTAIKKVSDGNSSISSSSADSECSLYSDENSTSTDSNPLGGYLEWDKTTQGTILGAFFWGYLIGQVPAGWIATRFGGKWVYAITMLVASVATVFTPLLADAHYVALIVTRIILGIATAPN